MAKKKRKKPDDEKIENNNDNTKGTDADVADAWLKGEDNPDFRLVTIHGANPDFQMLKYLVWMDRMLLNISQMI